MKNCHCSCVLLECKEQPQGIAPTENMYIVGVPFMGTSQMEYEI